MSRTPRYVPDLDDAVPLSLPLRDIGHFIDFMVH